MVQRLFLCAMMALSLAACSTLKTADREDAYGANDLSTEDTEVKELNIISDEDVANASQIPQKYLFVEKDLDNPEKSEQIPVEVNLAVQKWINYFQGRGKPHMERYLSRSSRYLPLMKNILRKHGLPEDLVYVALIESGFNSTAYSHASAVGYWQFIRGTAKVYGLRVDSFVDERRDFVLSTQAAAKYFKALYNLFGEWYLAIAAYNVGENRIKNLVMRYYTRDFWELARKHRLPNETINYVPKYIAAKLIAKDPAKYGFTDIPYEKPLAFDELEYDTPVNIQSFSEAIGEKYQDFQRLNPSFRGKLAPLNSEGKVVLKVPNEKLELAKNLVSQHTVTDPRMIASLRMPDYIRYKVRRGDTLGAIARKFRTRISTIRELNSIRGNSIRAGKYIRVPNNEDSKFRGSTNVEEVASANTPAYASYRVKAGDTLTKIAAIHKTTIAKLKAINKMQSRTRVLVGAQLRVPNTKRHTAALAKKKSVHVVRSGDTLTEIARRYNTNIPAIAKANKLSAKAYIPVGKRLVIPE